MSPLWTGYIAPASTEQLYAPFIVTKAALEKDIELNGKRRNVMMHSISQRDDLFERVSLEKFSSS